MYEHFEAHKRFCYQKLMDGKHEMPKSLHKNNIIDFGRDTT